MSNTIFYTILLVNLIVTIGVSIYWHKKEKNIIMAVYFLLLPVVGLVIYAVSLWMYKIGKKTGYDRETLVKRLDVETPHQMPSLRKELDIIPVQEAMAVSDVEEKRHLLLEQLKKDEENNYYSILAAGRDEDSESAHYVAAARMQAYRKKFMDILEERDKIYGEVEEDEEIMTYLSMLSDYIDSELLEEKEADLYKKEYCNVIEKELSRINKMLGSVECTNYLHYMFSINGTQDIEKVWSLIPMEKRSEESYFTMIKFYYRLKKKVKFYECIDELKKSKIMLSPKGIEMLRYWEARRG